MKIKLIILIITAICTAAMPAYADDPQQEASEKQSKPEVSYFVEIVSAQSPVNKSATVNVELGRLLPARLALKDNEVKQLTQSLSFGNPVDALNYLSFRGWELVDTYTVTRANTAITHYVMRFTSSEPLQVIKSLAK